MTLTIVGSNVSAWILRCRFHYADGISIPCGTGSLIDDAPAVVSDPRNPCVRNTHNSSASRTADVYVSSTTASWYVWTTATTAAASSWRTIAWRTETATTLNVLSGP